jgi:hypothetical protein
MKRCTACLVLLLVLGCTAAAQARAAAQPTNLVGVDLVDPPPWPAVVGNSFINSYAVVTGDDSADSCIQRHLDELLLPRPQLPVRCHLVSYVSFWIDLPATQRRHPKPSQGCPAARTGCQFMGQDDQAPYSLVERYGGPPGRHVATAHVWRYVWGDSQPVLLATASKRFCLYHCKPG